MDAHAGDVQALADYLSLDRPAVVGYSLGSMIAGRLLGLPWVSAAALCGTGSEFVEGELDLAGGPILPGASVEGCWDDYPNLGASAAWLNYSARISSPSAQSPGACGGCRRTSSAPRPCPCWS